MGHFLVVKWKQSLGYDKDLKFGFSWPSPNDTRLTQLTKASYCVALRIAKTGKPHNIDETLLLPAATDICSIMKG